MKHQLKFTILFIIQTMPGRTLVIPNSFACARRGRHPDPELVKMTVNIVKRDERFGFGLEIASTAQMLTEQMKRWGLLTGTIQPTTLDVVHAGYSVDQSGLNTCHLTYVEVCEQTWGKEKR